MFTSNTKQQESYLCYKNFVVVGAELIVCSLDLHPLSVINFVHVLK
jgi:hypothetical protein